MSSSDGTGQIERTYGSTNAFSLVKSTSPPRKIVHIYLLVFWTGTKRVRDGTCQSDDVSSGPSG
jgi:hypothetical protein